jgi:hypothetical protein
LDFHQPPDDLTPGLSGVLAANGRAALEHAMAAIFSLADRGVLAIEEEPRRMLGSRNFEITRRADAGPLRPHQERILEVMFRDRSGNSQKVSLMKARNRLTSRWTQVAKAFQEELGAAGFLDEARWRLRRRYRLAAVAFMVTAAIGIAPVVPFIGRFGPWPLLIPAALLAVGVASLIVGATITVLSNEGVRRARQWRDYRKYLRMVAGGKTPALGGSLGRALPYAVALDWPAPGRSSSRRNHNWRQHGSARCRPPPVTRPHSLPSWPMGGPAPVRVAPAAPPEQARQAAALPERDEKRAACYVLGATWLNVPRRCT